MARTKKEQIEKSMEKIQSIALPIENQDVLGIVFTTDQKCSIVVEFTFENGKKENKLINILDISKDFFGNEIKKPFYSSALFNFDSVKKINVLSDNVEIKYLCR